MFTRGVTKVRVSDADRSGQFLEREREREKDKEREREMYVSMSVCSYR